ncbi:MAG: bifunctional metallophosphatase/5'-nucleotidase [Proteobacteria bacterium]|nr:bifunctional metallophosphatase/5'-nucleotidase [Pseudomonadota bacterium]MBU1060056.1 bifunctional metallophosphatase/5'-nucleotidase [Pseudomonadota bacterium]
MKATRIILFSVLCILGLGWSSPSAAPSMTAGASQLTFLGTADLQGQLEPSLRSIALDAGGEKIAVVGGIARIATLIKEIRKESQGPVIILSAGDDLMGRYFHTFNGHAIFTLLGRAGYEILALGNHEFDRGPGLLAEALEETTFVPLCSDLAIKDTVLEGSCQPLLIRQYQSVSIGFFSLMTPNFPFITTTGKVSLSGSPAAVAQQMVSELRAQGTDLVVAITHIGADLDRQLAAEVEGIDIIFGGHSHAYLPKLETVNKSLIVNGGEKGAALVRLDVKLSSDRKIIPESAAYTLIPVTESISQDQETAQHLQHFSDQLPAAIVLGKTESTWLLDKNAVRSGESTVADMINDLILDKFQVDFVLNNAGAFRGNKEYPPGPITDTMLHEIDEFENDVYLLKIKGKYLYPILEHSAALVDQGGFLQVAGLRLSINPGKRAQEISQRGEDWQVVKPGERIIEAQIRNRDGSYGPIEAEKEYALATNAYLAQNEGDQYYWFKKYGRDQVNTYTTLYSLLAEKLNTSQVLNPPPPDGRIRLLTAD